ncbi:hypothetical protein NN3_13200 [Nocardia neocaledoniensis NBRC 108232]|uniref:Alkylhydroperoxidase family enzyme n=1 Tax=Nocardia neocaledoniensis TaxID=236511 RepID=A0A317N700_9NOCA|nr:carboxymuconolactone decarboxylase family protein [Nocardia neocaledoniensis]PWV71025.1 hypothetical protein DFR69_11114 [Nocardia neocaledoniensis]GEM30313.1 hypothetical protein NN3_13200 [Nocardia neocaledoniensis NBRC 108232]
MTSGRSDHPSLPRSVREALAGGHANLFAPPTRHRGLIASLLISAEHILRGCSLPPALRDLAVLRVGYTHGAASRIHHQFLVATAGLSLAAVVAAQTGDLVLLSEDEADVVRWTDLLLRQHTFTDPDRSEALELFTLSQLADFELLVGFYQIVYSFLAVASETDDDDQP